MPNEDDENINSQNDETDQDDQDLENADDDSEDGDEGDDAGSDAGDDDGAAAKDDDDADALKEKNKQLFARAKKAEGFVLKDGKWVKKAKAPAPAKPPVKTNADDGGSNQPVDVNDAVQKALDKRDLDALDVSDSIKKEIKIYARQNKVSVLEAAKAPYITFLKGEAEKKSKSEEASNGGKRKTQPVSNFKDASPDDFDMTTEQGRKDFAAYKKYLNENS